MPTSGAKSRVRCSQQVKRGGDAWVLGGLWVLLHIAAQSVHVSTRRHQIHPHRNEGWEGGQEPSSRGLMRPELKPVSRDQCEGMLHSLPAQQLTCVLGAFVPAQVSDGLSLALRPPPTPPTPHLLKTRPWQGPRLGECGRGSCCPQPRSAPACPASRGWHVGTRSMDRQV